MNILTAIPPRVRLALYVVYGVGSVFVTYFAAKGLIGVEEVAVWTGLGAFFSLTAGGNVDLGELEQDEVEADARH